MNRESRYWNERCGCRAKAMAAMVVSAIALVAIDGKAEEPLCTTKASGTTSTYYYTGAAQLWMVPLGVPQAEVKLIGACGGNCGFEGGLGGMLDVSGSVTPGYRYQVNVGGKPTGPGTGGWNGGGIGGSVYLGQPAGGCGGGGASDVRQGSFTYDDRILIAGGGGGDGSGNGSTQGGSGSGSGSGSNGGYNSTCNCCTSAVGGGMSGGGHGGWCNPTGLPGSDGSKFWGGNGATGSYFQGSGGGGGYYGGGGGAVDNSNSNSIVYLSGAGGSGYYNPNWNLISSGTNGSGNNGEIIFTYQTNTPWTSLGVTTATDPTALTWNDGSGRGRIDVFYIDTGGNMQQMFREAGGVWNGPVILYSPSQTKLSSVRPAAASWGPGSLYLFAKGNDSQLYFRSWTSVGGWTNWLTLGGSINSAPTVASYGSGHLDVFARGTNNDLQHLAYANGAWWTNWESKGGVLASAPAAVSNAPNRFEVYVKDTNGGGGLSYIVWDGNNGGWSNWFQLDDGGVTLSSDPAASWDGVNYDTNVFFRDSSNGITSRSCIPGSWFAWQPQGPVTSGAGAQGAPNGAAPAVVPTYDSNGVNEGVVAFIRGTGNILYTAGTLP